MFVKEGNEVVDTNIEPEIRGLEEREEEEPRRASHTDVPGDRGSERVCCVRRCNGKNTKQNRKQVLKSSGSL